VTAPPRDIIEAMTSAAWWGPWFKRGDWGPWQTVLRAAFGLGGMDLMQRLLLEQYTGRVEAPTRRAREAWAIVGRRGGKTRVMALIAAYLGAFEDWRVHLAPGEVASILVVAKDRSQARTAFRYVRSLFMQHPLLRDLVANATQDTIELNNRVVIEVATASYRSLRGYTIAAMIADEIAFWFDGDTSANPAEEILAGARPAMISLPGSMLLVASSPHAKRGPLWETYRHHYAQQFDPVFVWKAPTITMNRSAPQDVIDQAYADDPAAAAANYGAEFRNDLEPYVSREVVEAAVVSDRFELPRVAGRSYHAFADPAGGSGQDSFTFAIAHRDKDGTLVLDVLRERKPQFSPSAVTAEFAQLAKSYGISEVIGDQFGGDFPGEQFRLNGVRYKPSEATKSQIFQNALAFLNSGRIELLDQPRLVAQTCALERKTSRAGRDSISHPDGAGQHDDLPNAALGALLAAHKPRGFEITEGMMRYARGQPSGLSGYSGGPPGHRRPTLGDWRFRPHERF
jgi:hypothetical protein